MSDILSPRRADGYYRNHPCNGCSQEKSCEYAWDPDPGTGFCPADDKELAGREADKWEW